jgi:CBS domain-containing protein
MYFVRDLLLGKHGQVWTTEPQATVYKALELMSEQNVGALPVVEDGHVVGVFSERDCIRKVLVRGKSPHATAVQDVMSHPVIIVQPDTPVEVCMELMTNQHVRHLPVMEDDQLVGIVSIGDVLKAQIADRDVLIRDMEHYIAGTYTH